MQRFLTTHKEISSVEKSDSAKKALEIFKNIALLGIHKNDSHFPSGADRLSAKRVISDLIKHRSPYSTGWQEEFASFCRATAKEIKKIVPEKEIFEELFQLLNNTVLKDEGKMKMFFETLSGIVERQYKPDPAAN